MSPAKSGNSAEQLQGNWIEQAKANPFIDRALEICSGLIDRTTPLSVKQVSRLLKRRAAEKGLPRIFHQHAPHACAWANSRINPSLGV
jgi:hypothetical protein